MNTENLKRNNFDMIFSRSIAVFKNISDFRQSLVRNIGFLLNFISSLFFVCSFYAHFEASVLLAQLQDVATSLARLNCGEIDMVVYSHGHPDHFGGRVLAKDAPAFFKHWNVNGLIWTGFALLKYFNLFFREKLCFFKLLHWLVVSSISCLVTPTWKLFQRQDILELRY